MKSISIKFEPGEIDTCQEFRSITLIVPVIIAEDGGMIVGAVRAKHVIEEIKNSLPYIDNLKNSKRVLHKDYLSSLSEEIRWCWPFNERS